jgi:hypothetical protein
MQFIGKILAAAMVSGALVTAGPVTAQEFDSQPMTEYRAGTEYSSNYTLPTTSEQANVRATIHHNAQTRAQQRQLRLSSMSWYGMSNARPTASLTPFCSIYSPVWQMPGPQPFAWHTTNRPAYLIYR